MNWRCNCGKVMELSHEQLLETGGVVVCPQCLGSSTVPGYAKPRRKPAIQQPISVTPTPPRPATTPRQATRPISFSEPSQRQAPPPHKPRRATPSQSGAQRPPRHSKVNKKNTSRDGSGNNILLNPPGVLGCVWRSLAVTAVLLALYIFLGLLLHV